MKTWGNLILAGIIACFFSGIGGCTGSQDENAYKIDEYFKLMEFINEEMRHYEEHPPDFFRKTVHIDDKAETREKAPDSLKELKSILETADINKPGLRGVYKTDTSIKVRNADTLYGTVEHRLKPDEDALVVSIKLYFNGPPNDSHLSKILIYKNRSNFLYQNAQYIYIDLLKGHISNLTLEGGQQILFFAPHHFKASFEVGQ